MINPLRLLTNSFEINRIRILVFLFSLLVRLMRISLSELWIKSGSIVIRGMFLRPISTSENDQCLLMPLLKRCWFGSTEGSEVHSIEECCSFTSISEGNSTGMLCPYFKSLSQIFTTAHHLRSVSYVYRK